MNFWNSPASHGPYRWGGWVLSMGRQTGVLCLRCGYPKSFFDNTEHDCNEYHLRQIQEHYDKLGETETVYEIENHKVIEWRIKAANGDIVAVFYNADAYYMFMQAQISARGSYFRSGEE